ncbi:hypothetical protein RA210_U10398 [Rubrivivax sp. A210]|uniref:DUF3577 domain-containing protein n=1 Tax=Rubrivivax sp. A210 TaxID=2772301 RepID=UPI001918331D|nr:DUF3577 domain-containing protein [Rubrivivax sp. A210]CAD5366584.1 hypothetical protein RA210_U10398 [Rubrivivax sp. A210]
MNQAQQSQAQAFDLIIEGVGYLNRVRTVTPKKGPAYMACTINALMGRADAVEHVSIDCIVVGTIAKQAVRQLTEDVEAKRKVFIGFRAGDPKPDFYEFPDRETGEPKKGSGLKARLLQLTLAKVNGIKVDIPLVPRNSQPESAAGHAGHNDDGGVGSACGDESSRQREPAHA